jgi:hypothetical protein
MKNFEDCLGDHGDFLDGSENVIISGGSLTLKKIQADQAGEYSCIVEQKLGTVRNIQQRDFELIVAGESLFDDR